VRSADAAEKINDTRESTYLPGVKLGAAVTATSELAQAVAGKPLIVSVTPSHVVRHVLGEAAFHIGKDAVVVSASKGIEEGTLQTIDQIYGQVLPSPLADRAAFLSGPTFAKELARGLPGAIVVASRRPESALLVQRELATDRFRVYTTDDVTGVEIGGALKNICAIGAGIADGLGYGHNTRAALITRGLSEIARLGARLGANPLTFAGLAGMGDLVLTCTGDLSRNRQVGLELGRGKKIEEILAGMQSVAEGVKTTRAAHDLGVKLGVELPITDAIYSILYEGKSPPEAVADLLRREQRPERD
jgi:glycerol-3-phosphate dehydrogenase (NAD(P)+)